MATKIEDLSPEELENLKRSLTKNAHEVKIKESILFGKDARKQRPRGLVVKGGINWRLNPKDPLIVNK